VHVLGRGGERATAANDAAIAAGEAARGVVLIIALAALALRGLCAG
jgi:hypothetical protein